MIVVVLWQWCHLVVNMLKLRRSEYWSSWCGKEIYCYKLFSVFWGQECCWCCCNEIEQDERTKEGRRRRRRKVLLELLKWLGEKNSSEGRIRFLFIKLFDKFVCIWEHKRGKKENTNTEHHWKVLFLFHFRLFFFAFDFSFG